MKWKDVFFKLLNYNNINETVNEYIDSGFIKQFTQVFITDISVNEETAKRLDVYRKETCTPIYLLDHHKTALWLNDAYGWYTVQEKLNDRLTCGTELFYDYIIADKCELKKDFVEAIRMYDTWEWKNNPNEYSDLANKLNKLYYYYNGYECVNQLLANLYSGVIINNKQETILEVLIKQENDGIKDYLRKLVVCKEVTTGLKVGFVYAENYISELGNAMCLEEYFEEDKPCDIAVVINANTGKCSLRTVNENLNPIVMEMKSRGMIAGGHIKAGGFTVNKIYNYNLSDIQELVLDVIRISFKG